MEKKFSSFCGALAAGALFGVAAGLASAWVFRAEPILLEFPGAELAVSDAPAYLTVERNETAAEELLDFAETSEESGVANLDYDSIFEKLEAARFRVVPKSMLRRIPGDIISDSGEISSKATGILQLSSAEIERLNAVIATATDRLTEIETGRAELVSSSADEVAYRIEAFPGEGKEIMAEVREQFLRILGERDGRFLWELIDEPDSYWAGFGRETVDVRFRVKRNDDESVNEIGFTFQNADPDRRTVFRSRGWGSGLADQPIRSVRAGRYSYLVPMLPPEVKPFFTEE